jgi:hypothetical protein
MKFRIIISVITLTFLVYTKVYAQYSEALENKKGFNKFVLETPFKNYQNDLILNLTGFDGVKYYKYVKTDIKVVFGVEIKEIKLGFFENMLYTISIEFGAIEDFKIQQLDRNLVDIFGMPLSVDPNYFSEAKYQSNRVWKGQTVWLQRDTYSCDDVIAPCTTSIFLVSLRLRQLIKDKSF